MSEKVSRKSSTSSKSLSKIERRYCSCIMMVLGDKKQKQARKENPQLTPFGLCTHSVYNSKGLKRTTNPECGPYYKFEKYPIESLREYAKQRKINVTKNNKYKSKQELSKELYNYIKKTYKSK